jgi:type I restriction enzyme R subunit
VHFAVSHREVMMTTRLAGPATASCPSTGATTAVRATRPTRKALRTAYLWEEVWAARQLAGNPGPLPDRQARRQEAAEGVIFPRYHQLDATRKLVAAVLAEGPGQRT